MDFIETSLTDSRWCLVVSCLNFVYIIMIFKNKFLYLLILFYLVSIYILQQIR